MSKPIKIIHIIPTLDMGGAERAVIDLVKTLDRSIFEISLIILKRTGPWASELEKEGISVTVLGQKDGLGFLLLPKLIFILRNARPDIVHTHLFGADIYGRIAARLAGAGRIISTEHNLNISEGWLKKIFKKHSSKLSDAIIASSAAIRDYIVRSEGVSPSKIMIVRYGADIDKFLNPDRLYGNQAVIGSIGRLTAQKGFNTLIEALSMIKGRRMACRIAGAGELRNELNCQIRANGLDNEISLVGHVNSAEFLKSIDIFVLPSRWEGLGIVLLEAGLSGLPVIASDIDGIKEVIDNGIDGVLVKAGDAAGLSAEIVRLAGDIELRKRMGLSLRKKILENFSLEKMAKAYEDIYLNTQK